MIKLSGKDRGLGSLGFDFSPIPFSPAKQLDLLKNALQKDKLNWGTLSSFKFSPHRFFGLEIEVQNISPDVVHRVSSMLNQWVVVNDGSLKNNGKEFVSHALRGNQVYSQLYYLWTIFKLQPSDLDFGWRTSSHVHVNATSMTLEQVYKFLLLYAIFENCLFEFAGNFRKKSPFCVPLTRTNLADNFHSIAVEQQGSILDLLVSNDKYCALNLQHLGLGENSKRYGTIEFRHFPGAKRPLKFFDWICMIDELMTASEIIPQEDVINAILSLNSTSEYYSFLRKVFPVMWNKLETDNLKQNMEEGIKYCKAMLTEPFKITQTLTLKNSPAIRFFKPKTEALEKSVPPRKIFAAVNAGQFDAIDGGTFIMPPGQINPQIDPETPF